MDCLKDYIGLKGCSDDEPESGLFINSLAGVTSEILELAAEREQRTGRLAWADIQQIAGHRFYTGAISELRKRYVLKQIREYFKWSPDTEGDVEPASAEMRGVLLQFAFTNYSFQSFVLAKLFFVADAAGSVTFKVLDRNGTELYTTTKTVVEGFNVFAIDKTFVADTIFIAVDATAVDTKESELLEADVSCFCQSVMAYCTTCTPSITGHKYALGQYTKTSGNTHGIGVEGFIGCDYTSLICNNKELFTSAWLYLLGNQAIVELLNSNRINKPTTVDRERYTELRDYYQVEYENQLRAAIEGFAINPNEDCCLECAQPIKRVQWLP